MTLGPVLAALADPTRRSVVERLAAGEATVGALAEGRPMSLPAFSKHLAVLEQAGLVHRRRAGRTVVCSLAAGPLDDLAAWVSTTTAYWTATLDRLEHVLEEDS